VLSIRVFVSKDVVLFLDAEFPSHVTVILSLLISFSCQSVFLARLFELKGILECQLDLPERFSVAHVFTAVLE
jgi:hypothetical protein